MTASIKNRAAVVLASSLVILATISVSAASMFIFLSHAKTPKSLLE